MNKKEFTEDLANLLKKHGIKSDDLTQLDIRCSNNSLIIFPTYER